MIYLTIKRSEYPWARLFGQMMAGLALAVLPVGAFSAEPLPNEVTIRNVEFVLIPEGEFYRHRGVLPGVEPAGEMTKVWLDAYYIAKYEARARDLVPFINQNQLVQHLYSGKNESCSVRKGKDGAFVQLTPWLDLPATHLSWALADRWAHWMGFRLPTEAEWEKAARGVDQRVFPWGDHEPDETYTNFYTASLCQVWPVDRAAKGRSPHGVFNMAGNVSEYVADWHEGDRDAGRIAYFSRLQDEAKRYGEPPPKTSVRLLKGGAWAAGPLQLKISHRQGWRDEEVGFRSSGARFAIDALAVREFLAKGAALVTRP